MDKAISKLEKGVSISDHEGHKVHFGHYVLNKYLKGIGRNGIPDVNRLKLLSQAILCIEKNNAGIIIHINDNPPQKSYLHILGKNRAVIVFADAHTGEVRSFIRGKLKKMEIKHKTV